MVCSHADLRVCLANVHQQLMNQSTHQTARRVDASNQLGYHLQHVNNNTFSIWQPQLVSQQ